MKKMKPTLLSFLLLPCCLWAQIPNADFELWEEFYQFTEIPRDWDAPFLTSELYPVEKVSNPNMGQYAVLTKNIMPTPSGVGGAPGYIETVFTPSSQRFRLSMDVRYDSIAPPGKARVVVKASGFNVAYWIDENITGDMETIQMEVELPQAYNTLVLQIEARGVYNPDYGTPPFNGGYDGYAEIVVDNIVYENVTSSGEALQGKEVQVFPNPAVEAMWVKTETGEPIHSVNVFNSNGEVLLSAAPAGNEHLLDVRSLPVGVYWMEIALPGRRVVRQWVKR